MGKRAVVYQSPEQHHGEPRLTPLHAHAPLCSSLPHINSCSLVFGRASSKTWNFQGSLSESSQCPALVLQTLSTAKLVAFQRASLIPTLMRVPGYWVTCENPKELRVMKPERCGSG